MSQRVKKQVLHIYAIIEVVAINVTKPKGKYLQWSYALVV